MSPELCDLLMQLLMPGASVEADMAIQAFRQFTTALGLEFCNYGVFEIDNYRLSADQFTDTNMPAEWIEEYLAEGLYSNDYALRQAETLSLDRPFATFEFGDWLVPELKPKDEKSRPVLLGAADAGMRDALAFVGRSPVAPGETKERFFGFAFGGDRGSAGKAREYANELMIGAFAVIEALKPYHAARLEGFDMPLSMRERDVLGCHAQGLRRDLIAHRLNISLSTVDLHTANLRRKLKAQTIAEAVAKGYRYAIL